MALHGMGEDAIKGASWAASDVSVLSIYLTASAATTTSL
jgi:hypothetical protein